jgi:Protein of unknown function (DUF2510)
MSTNGAGWQPDPSGRHEYRWWDGTAWSDAVIDQGVEHRDPIGASVPPAAPGLGYGAAPPPSPGAYPAGPDPYGGYAPAYQPAPGPPGPPGQQGQRPSRGRSTWTLAGFAALGVLIAGSMVVLGVVAANRNSDSDDDPEQSTGPAAIVDPRTALVTVDDLPAGWTESEVTYPPGENQVCEPRLEPPTPPRAAERSFDRASPSGAITHRVVEYSPEFAADYIAEAERQAGECGTFETETQSGGEAQRFTGTSELLTGPSFGDETLWYRIQVNYVEPTPSTHAVLVVLDRHGGVISGFTLSTTSETTSDADRAMVEELTRLAAERLTGGGGS